MVNTSTTVAVQTPPETASRKKLALSSSPVLGPSSNQTPAASVSSMGTSNSPELPSLASDECIAGKEKLGYRLLKLEILDTSLSEIAVCVLCHSPLLLNERFGQRRGLVSTIKIRCSNPTCHKSVSLSDPFMDDSLNDASILGTRLGGCGPSALEELSACIGMLPPLTRPKWTEHNKKISVISSAVAKDSCVQAAQHLHQVIGKPLDEVIDVIVTVDGTWQKRGHTSLFGIVVAIAWKTGQVLDIEVLSKHCPACSKKSGWDAESEEYKEWFEEHKDTCQCNHTGSSNAMEIEGVKKIWLRSVADLKLRYTTFIGDGDAKTFATLQELKPYGPDVELIKHECVGHVQKRMGTALRNLKKSGVVDEEGRAVKFKGRLTNDSLKKLNIYYGGAIHNSNGSIDAMVQAIDASFLHSVSTDEYQVPTAQP